MSYLLKTSNVCQYFLLFLLFSCAQNTNDKPISEEHIDPPLFSLLSSSETNIDFKNTLDEGLNTNILMYEYFYNGGGVATGDFNGDDLIDIYFTSNMSDNKLYVNRGNLKFNDVTTISGAAGRPGPWKTGATIVDINGDRKLDLYLCYSGALPGPKRKNQLFINQGNDINGIPKFIDEAEKYGLASSGFSNQAYFFDYDRDQDLDMLLLNHNPKSLPILNEQSTKEFLQIDDPDKGIRLFQQHNGVFKDVTKISGLSGSALSYGLGLGITDFDNDGWLDFYVSNDYAVPDYLYINNQNGTFSDKLGERIGHNSQFSMGNDVADINNDGFQDIFTLDMLPEDNRRQKLLLSPDSYSKFDLNVRSGFHYQYMRNMLQLNNKNGSFSEVGQMFGISNTDWSWAALLADYNNDGWKDLYVTNGYYRDYTNRDFIQYMDDYVKSKGRLVREEVIDLVNKMPSSNIVNYIFTNDNGSGFLNKTSSWGMDRPSNSNGAAYADLDNDGDLDLVVNNINQTAFIYRNESQRLSSNFLGIKLEGEGLNTMGLGARVALHSGSEIQSVDQFPSRGYLSAVSPVLHFGLGDKQKIDSLVVTWNGEKQQVIRNISINQILTISEESAKVKEESSKTTDKIYSKISSPISHRSKQNDFNDFYRQPLLINELSFEGPCMTKGDVNSDGLEDVIIGGVKGQSAALFMAQGNGEFVRKGNQDFIKDESYEDAATLFFDANSNGHLDLYIASGGYHDFHPEDPKLQDRLYLNDGKGNFKRSSNALPNFLVSTGCVLANDINQDGYLDLFVGGRVVPGNYPVTPDSYILINDGQGNFENQTDQIAPALKEVGMVTDGIWIDINSNGAKELIVVGEWMPICVFENKNGKLIENSDNYFEHKYSGWWNNIEVGHFDEDSLPDLIVGNVGTNTQFRVSEKEPAQLYYKDFDGNGSVDPIFCYYIQGKSYPYVTRDELLKQLAQFGSKYTSYNSFANETIQNIFGNQELQNAELLEAVHFKTSLFLNSANGFKIKELPQEVQYSQINAIVISDVDNDSVNDLLLFGNNSHPKLRLGKMDANYGVLLKGMGNGEFNYIGQDLSGFNLKGDVRSVVEVENTILFGINQNEIEAYKLNNN